MRPRLRFPLITALLCLVLTPLGWSDYQAQVYEARDRVLPSLVHIQPVVQDFNTGEMRKLAQVGSGVIFHPDGYVVTNYHVAGNATRIICTLNDKEQVTAELVGGDPPTDLAVIKLNLDEYDGEISVAEFGRSADLQVGQQVLAMGSPLSLARSVTAGVISTRDRYFAADIRLPSGERTGRYNLWIQTDAAINPGNSGGPLVDLAGQVVGINSRAAFLANNVGFSIPVDIVRAVAEELIANGSVTRSWIGVQAQALQELESYFGASRDNGVLIASVDPGSPAATSMLRAGDIITAIDGIPVSARYVEELPAFYNLIASHAPGAEMSLSVLRDSATFAVSVVPRALGDLLGDDFEVARWEFTVKGITHQMQIENQLPDSNGVMVIGVKPVGAADQAGIRRGDVVRAVNREPVAALVDFADRYTQLADVGGDRVFITLWRAGATRYAVIKLDDLGELGVTE